MKEKSKNCFIEFRKNPNAKIRLFCFHYGGGSALAFMEWPEYLNNSYDIIAIQLPGRGGDSAELLDDIDNITEMLSVDFVSYIDKPCVFLGHSMGALIAFEFATTLRNMSIVQPCHLVVSGINAPHIPLNRPHLHNVSDEMLVREIEKYNGVQKYLLSTPEFLNIFLPIIRADFKIIETYKYMDRAPLDCPITALGGIGDYNVTNNNLIEWKHQTINRFCYHSFQGDHFFIRTARKEVIEIVDKILQTVILENF